MKIQERASDIKTRQESERILNALLQAIKTKLGIGTGMVPIFTMPYRLESGKRIKIEFSVTESRGWWYAHEIERVPKASYDLIVNFPRVTQKVYGEKRRFDEFGIIQFRRFFIRMVEESDWFRAILLHEIVHIIGDCSGHRYRHDLDHSERSMEHDSFVHQAAYHLDQEAARSEDPYSVYGKDPVDYTDRLIKKIETWPEFGPHSQRRVRKRAASMYPLAK